MGEYDAAGGVIKEFGWKPGGTWSTDPLFMRNSSGEYFWYHNDHLGTPQMMTTSSGAVVWKAKYTSFGKATVDPSSTVDNPLRFPGQYEDIETGLLYNHWRYYNAEVGRYFRSDPIGFWGGVNFFTYALNDPNNNFDPDGQLALVEALVVFTTVVAITTVILMNESRRHQPRTFPVPDFPDNKRKFRKHRQPEEIKDSPNQPDPLPPDRRTECQKMQAFMDSSQYRCMNPMFRILYKMMYIFGCWPDNGNGPGPGAPGIPVNQ